MPPQAASRCSRLVDFYWSNYLPLMMIFVVFFGFLIPAPGAELDKPDVSLCETGATGCDMGTVKVVSSACIFMQFVLSGLGLKTDDIVTALKEWKGICYAFVSTNFMTGCMAFFALQLPFEPQELAVGIAIFCAMPTTLSSGAVLVGQAEGNVTLALLLTAGTNILGIFTIPFMLKLYLASSTDVRISPVPMLIKLLGAILFPLCIGKALRQIKPLADFRLRNKVRSIWPCRRAPRRLRRFSDASAATYTFSHIWMCDASRSGSGSRAPPFWWLCRG